MSRLRQSGSAAISTDTDTGRGMIFGEGESPFVSANTAMAIITACGVALTGAIGVLWRHNEASNKKRDERADKLEQKNGELHSEILGVTREVGELKGRYDGITSMCESTLKAVDNAIKNNNSNNSGA